MPCASLAYDEIIISIYTIEENSNKITLTITKFTVYSITSSFPLKPFFQ